MGSEDTKQEILNEIKPQVDGQVYETVLKLLDKLAAQAEDEGKEYARENPPEPQHNEGYE